MSRNYFSRAALAALLIQAPGAYAADAADLKAIRAQIDELKQNYEQRIAQLEQRLHELEAGRQAAPPPPAPPPPIPVQAAASRGANAFNPAVSLIISGTYGQFRQDPAQPATGFAMKANNPGYDRGFSLKESELALSASIDPAYRGVATLALDPAGGVSVENAYVQTSALGNGLNLKFGRFFSGFGYLNEQHAHAWDFVDQPLVYRSFWDNQLGEDGMQIKWLAPTDLYLEFGGEIGRGRGFPGTDRQKNGNGAATLFAHAGGDVGVEHSWRAGISLHQTRRIDAISTGVPDLAGTPGGVSNSFSGDSRTAGLDFIWKYAPNGNISERYLKLQGEYFQRRENGQLTYNLAAPTTGNYAVTQNGWYLQGVYQFRPHWRSGLRYDRLDPGTAAVGAPIAASVIGNYAFKPSRLSWMLDYNLTEFSRLRLQLARDKSRQGQPDTQLFLQYIMSLGAHGAHQY